MTEGVDRWQQQIPPAERPPRRAIRCDGKTPRVENRDGHTPRAVVERVPRHGVGLVARLWCDVGRWDGPWSLVLFLSGTADRPRRRVPRFLRISGGLESYRERMVVEIGEKKPRATNSAYS